MIQELPNVYQLLSNPSTPSACNLECNGGYSNLIKLATFKLRMTGDDEAASLRLNQNACLSIMMVWQSNTVPCGLL